MTKLETMESAPGPETVIDGRRWLYFGGTSYLGLAGHSEVIEAGCEALRRYGVHSATTRARFGTIPPVREVEERAAAFFGCEDAFYFGSGYVANHIMVSAIAAELREEGGIDAVLVDAGAHYCVLEAARLVGVPVRTFAHGSAEDLARCLRECVAARPLVMADAVGPSSGRLAPVADYLHVLESGGGPSSGATLLLDDAHGFGVLGDRGRGLLEVCDLWDRVNRDSSECPGASKREDGVSVRIRVCGTLAKALGGFGGVIPGSSAFVAAARRASHYYDGASAPAAAVAGSTAKALEIVQRNPGLRMRLRSNQRRLREGLRRFGLDVPPGETAHFGVSLGDAETMQRIHDGLLHREILVPYIGAYTGIPEAGVLRFAVFANHTESQIDRLLDALKEILP